MRYTYQFTQVSHYENGNLVPVTDKTYEFVFSFGNTIDKILGNIPDSTVLITKDMWKEYPATNKEVLHTVCFASPSKQGFRRPLVMTQEADAREGVYEYKEVCEPLYLKEGQYLSDMIKELTETFVEGVRAVNEPAKDAPWDKLEEANVKYLMSYIRSEVYKQLLQDRDDKGMARAKEFLKNVLETFFSLIPDTLIDKFDDGLNAHDKIRSQLEGIPENDEETIKTILKSQGYFKRIEDFNHFVVLYKYILNVKNFFNHLVWVMFRSKIGMVTLKNVKKQLSALFEFVITVQDNRGPMENKDIIKEISSGDRYYKVVEGFLNKIYMVFEVEKLGKRYRAAICYKFQEECDRKYLNSRYKCWDSIKRKYKPHQQEEFRDLCLRYWGINEKNTYRPCKCEDIMDEFSKGFRDKEVWEPMRK